jgi:hypothetical protein
MNVNDAGKVIADGQSGCAVYVGYSAEQSIGSRLEVQVEVGGYQPDTVRRPKQPQQVVMQRVRRAFCGRKELSRALMNGDVAVMQLAQKPIQRLDGREAGALGDVAGQLPETG